jgi:hypothetical protein
MHLHTPDIDRYLDRAMDERTLVALDAQVSVCLPWTELLAQRAMERATWERRGLLGRLQRVDREAAEQPVRAQPVRAKAA